jgi:hypothetical protein
MSWEKFVRLKMCLYWRFLVIRSWFQSWSNFENIDRNSFSNLGKLVIKWEDSLRDPRFPTIFDCLTRCLLFCWCRDVDRWIRCYGEERGWSSYLFIMNQERPNVVYYESIVVYYEWIKWNLKTKYIWGVGVMKDSNLILRNLRASHTLSWSWNWNT